MSADPGRPSQHPSKWPRLQFRSIRDLFEEQASGRVPAISPNEEATWKMPVPPPSMGKPPGALLKAPFQPRELSPINHDHPPGVPQPYQLEAEPTRRIKALHALPAHQQQREKPSTLFNETQSEPGHGLALPRLPFVQTDEMETVPLPSQQRQQIIRVATTLAARQTRTRDENGSFWGSRCGRSRWLWECPGQHPEIWKRFSHPIWLRARRLRAVHTLLIPGQPGLCYL